MLVKLLLLSSKERMPSIKKAKPNETEELALMKAHLYHFLGLESTEEDEMLLHESTQVNYKR